MKPLVSLLFGMLVSAALAQADAEFIRSSYGNAAIKIVTATECKATLLEILNPEGTIEEGLQSLLNASAIDNRKLGCAAALVLDWRQEFKMPKYENLDPNYSFYFQWEPKKLEAYKDAERKSSCYNPYPADHLDHKHYAESHKACAGKWLTKEENEENKLNFERLQKEYLEARKKWEREQLRKSSIAALLVPGKPDRSKLQKLYERSKCHNPYAPQSKDYAWYTKSVQSVCEGKWLSKEEADLAKAEYESELTKYRALEKEYQNALKPVYAMMTDHEYDVRPAAIQIWEEYRCYNPHELGTRDHQYHLKENEAHCEGKWIDAERADELLFELRSVYADLAQELESWNAQKEERLEMRRRELDRKNAAFYEDYNLRRLLAHFHAYGEKDKNKNVDSFCADFEARQRRDQKFASHKLELSPYQERDWKLVQKYGLSEGELSAIRAYTGSYYGAINPAIWSNNIRPKDEIYLEVINAGLDRLPAYSATPVVRESVLPPEVLEEHKVGAIVTYKAYTSTSKKKNWSWSEDGQRFVIYGGRDGKNVERISHSPGEEEILFKAGTRFKVLSKKPRPGAKGRYEFVLVEVDEDGKPLAQLPKPKVPPTPKKKPTPPPAKISS